MSRIHLLHLGDGEPFRLREGGPVWHRAPNRGDEAYVTDPEGDTFAARHITSGDLFVFPVKPDWRDRRPRDVR